MQKDRIIEALMIIKDVCNEAEDCHKCPLRSVDNENHCAVSSNMYDPPCEWRINTEENWHAIM